MLCSIQQKAPAAICKHLKLKQPGVSSLTQIHKEKETLSDTRNCKTNNSCWENDRWRYDYSLFMAVFFFLTPEPENVTLSKVPPGVCSCLLFLSAALAHWDRDRWMDLATADSQPGDVRKSGANAEMVQMDITCCCFTYLSNIFTLFPSLASHMCLNKYSD